MAKKSAEIVAGLTRETLTGDVRDFLLDYMKDTKEMLPWHMQPEEKQREHIERATRAADRVVGEIVKIVAADGQRKIDAKVVSVTVKDGLRAVLSCMKTEQTLLDLGMAQGANVIIVVADDAAYRGQRKAAEPEPDQGAIFDETDAGKRGPKSKK